MCLVGALPAKEDSTMKFTKMHGTGNDYIYVNGFEEKLENPSRSGG